MFKNVMDLVPQIDSHSNKVKYRLSFRNLPQHHVFEPISVSLVPYSWLEFKLGSIINLEQMKSLHCLFNLQTMTAANSH